MAECIESLYDPDYSEQHNFQGKNLLYSRNPDFHLNKKKFEDEFKNNTFFKDNKDSEIENIEDIDDYKDELFKEGQARILRTSFQLPYDMKFPIIQQIKDLNPLLNSPQQQSISRSILFTSKNSLPKILSREFNDISEDLNTKLTNTIYNTRRSNIDHDKFRELIVIKKRVLSDGKHKVVDLDVSGRVVPRNPQESNLRLFLACVIFLLACILFTASMKFYKNYLKIKKIEPFVQAH